MKLPNQKDYEINAVQFDEWGYIDALEQYIRFWGWRNPSEKPDMNLADKYGLYVDAIGICYKCGYDNECEVFFIEDEPDYCMSEKEIRGWKYIQPCTII